MIPSPDDCPPAYGDCNCPCHTNAHVRHITPCCFPELDAPEVTTLPAMPADPVCSCGMPMSKNPHPDAGKLGALLEVGAVWMCIPCTRKALHKAYQFRIAAESKLAFLTAVDNDRPADEAWLRSIGAGDDASGCYITIPVPGTDDPDRAPCLEWLLDDEAPTRIAYLTIDGTDVGLTVKTRGQVRLLLQSLGIRSDVPWPEKGANEV